MSFVAMPLPFLRKGYKADPVCELQKLLNARNAAGLAMDGDFGPKTEAAVKSFQKRRGLTQTGIVTPQLWRVLGLKPPLEPLAETEILKKLGSPGQDIDDFVIPQLCGIQIGGGGRASGRVSAHPALIGKWIEVFAALKERGLIGHILTYDGMYNKRRMRGSQSWSRHSWGLAIDLNAAHNPFRKTAAAPWQDGTLTPLVHTFSEFGFTWGGWWNTPDGMHFEIARL